MELKNKILHHLSLGVPIKRRKYGLTEEEFLRELKELEREGLITFETIKETLPNGNPSPFNGEPKNIKLTQKGKDYCN